MSLKGYASLPPEALIAFPKDLEASAWRLIAPAEIAPAGVLDAAALLAAPMQSALKALLLYGVALVAAAVHGAPSLALAADDAFDRLQRLLKLDLERALLSRDPATVKAAQTLKAALTLGDGSGQTNLSYDAEVTFGRNQAALSQRDDLSPLIHLLGLASLIAEISDATEQLAVFVGRADQDPTLTAYARLKAARTQCARIFNGVHLTLQSLEGISGTPAARDHFAALLSPLNALIERAKPAAKPAPKGD